MGHSGTGRELAFGTAFYPEGLSLSGETFSEVRCEEVSGPTADLCSFASLSLEDLACEPHSTSHGSAGALFPSVVEELV